MDYHDIYTSKEFGLRLAKLRQHRGVSARQMSLDIGQNKNYINSIESGRNYPNMQNFFDICIYLHIRPKDFFQTTGAGLTIYEEFFQLISTLPPNKFHHLYLIACDMQE